MIVTEEEAKTKRCQEGFGPAPPQATVCNAPLTTGSPMFYAGGAMGGAAGVYPYTMSPLNCIGSACMAWRWRGYRDQKGNIFNDAAPHGTGDTEHVGYCGKAGKP